ncbi:MAG: hypothetical protein ACPG9K_04950 [Poseidonibacter sp.]
MKRFTFILILFIFIPNILFSDCHKAVVAITDLKINKLIVYLQDKIDEINDIKKERDTLEDDDPYKGNLSAQIEQLEKQLEERLAYYRKYYKSYNELRSSLLEKFNTNKELVMQYMGSSQGIQLQESKRGGQSDFIMSCTYSMSLTAPDNNYWDKFRGNLFCQLTDVQTGEIIVTLPQNKTVLGKYDAPIESLYSKAWVHIANKLPRSNNLEKTIREYLNYKSAKLEYTYDDEEKKEANGRETGELKISKISNEIPWGNPRPRNIAEFTLKAKQGTFIESNSNEILLTPDDYEKYNYIKSKYKTYDCNKGNITNKLSDKFTLSRTCFLGQSDETLMTEIEVPFECEKPYYTVTTKQKTTVIVKPIENYRGISKDLKSYQEDKDTYYITIDEQDAKIIQYHVDNKSTRKIHRQRYELNLDTCQYEIESEDKLIKNMGGQDILKSEDEGWGFEDDTKIYVSLPSSSNKTLSFTWKRLRDNGTYYKKTTYKKEIPKIAKNILGKINDMATLFRKTSKNSKEMEIFKNLYNYPGTPEEVQCGGRVTLESFLIPPLDALQDPDVEFSINIRPSTKNEVDVIKKRMNLK